MVIYEVNLEMLQAIYENYYQWLIPHINKMLSYAGFQKAVIQRQENLDAEHVKLTVSYSIASRDDLEDYFQNHASQLREESIAKFGASFKATRRVFEVLEEIQRPSIKP